MSKKCCGIIYSDSDEVCKVCGKPLTDDKDPAVGDGTEPEEMADRPEEEPVQPETDAEPEEEPMQPETDAEPEEEDVTDSEKASGPHVAFGITTIVLAVAGLALIGLCVYYLVLSPFYSKDVDKTPVYPELSVMSGEMMPLLEYAEPATGTDAVHETAEAVATPLDASDIMDDNTEESGGLEE